MRQILSFVLIALVASMVAGLPATFADSKLDSLVNIATKARTQVKFQLERSQTTSDELKTLFEKGNQQTEMLISAVRQNDVAQAKYHFLEAMKIFKQVSVDLSGPPQETVSLKAAQVSQVAPETMTNYKNDIDRTEKYVYMLKDLARKNSFTIDFSKVDALIQNARSSLAGNDIPSLEKVYVELRAALADIQNSIKQQTEQQQNNRAKEFANSYIAKIDAMLAQARQMGLSEDDVAKLIKAKEEIASSTDPNMLIVKIKQHSVKISQSEISVNQRILAEASKLDSKLADLKPYSDDTIKPKFDAAKRIVAELKAQTSADEAAKLLRSLDSSIKEIERYIQSKRDQTITQKTTDESRPAKSEEQKSTESRQEQPKQKEATKDQKTLAEISRLEARLAKIAPYVDDTIKPKFENAESLLVRLKNQEIANYADYLRSVRMLDLMIDNLEEYVKSLQNEQDKNNSDNNSADKNQEANRSDEKENRNTENR
jgi:hypothetical protein